MSKVYGFVAEPHKNGYYIVSPATQEGSVVRCHDLSGFCGSWDMKEGGVFFEGVSGESVVLCKYAMDAANTYAGEMNEEMK